MPNNIVNKVVEVCGMPLDEVEKRWTQAEEIVVKQYGKKNKRNFEIITGIFKHSLGKECVNKLGWETQWKKTPLTEAIDLLISEIIKSKSGLS